MFAFLRRRPAQLSDLSLADKKELFSAAEAAILSRMPNRKERGFIENRIGVPITKLADFQSFIDVGCKKVWASFRACHLVASTLVSAQMRIALKAADGSMTNIESPTDPASMLLATPNPFDSWEDMIYMWTFHTKLCGTAYWMKDAVNGKGQPLALYPLLPQYVAAIPDPKLKVKSWEYKVNGTVIVIPPESMIQFRRPHPNNLIMGLGDVEAGQDTISGYIDRNALDEKFLANGAQPSGVLTKKEATEDEGEWQAFREKWQASYEGTANAGKTAFLNGDWSYHKLGLTMQEMQAIERERWTVEQIFLIHGVPLSVAGLKDAANYATARQDAISFRQNECVPLLDLLVGRLNMVGGLAQAYNPNYRFVYDLAGLIDVEQLAKDYGPLVKLGAMTPNELRAMCGLQKSSDPYLDQFYIERNLVPLVLSGMSGAPTSPTDPIDAP